MFGGDLYSPPEGHERLPRTILDAFNRNNVSLNVLTKAGKDAAMDFDLFRRDDLFGATLTFLNPEKSKLWEPGAALPKERIAALKIAHELGIGTWASCEPVIEPEETLAVIKEAAPYVDFFWIGKWNHDARADTIDWPAFKTNVISLLDDLEKQYEIKRAFLEAV